MSRYYVEAEKGRVSKPKTVYRAYAECCWCSLQWIAPHPDPTEAARIVVSRATEHAVLNHLAEPELEEYLADMRYLADP